MPQVSAQPHSSHCMPCHVHRQCPCQPRGVGSACPQLLPIEPIALDRHCADALAHLVSSPLIAGVVDAAIDTREAGLLAQILPRACRLPPAGHGSIHSKGGEPEIESGFPAPHPFLLAFFDEEHRRCQPAPVSIRADFTMLPTPRSGTTDVSKACCPQRSGRTPGSPSTP